jgi:AcrR family transcriptional regulator
VKAKTAVNPRKKAKQKRSKSLVSSMVEATARILESYGYENISTNRIAELAGVSVGSLYQYFPGKDALVAAVIERQGERAMTVFEAEMRATAGLPLDRRVKALVKTSVDFFLRDSKISRELFAIGADPQVVRVILSFRRRAASAVAELIQERISGSNATPVAYVIVNSIMGVVLTSILDDETPMDRERMVEELTALCKGYLGIG